ncbi:hypothetical protein V498_04829 [Pseudogymnoascus sp. VKM F-4517 (FW-2822)]|nr:hypothetical protein V498_04829 [Pseudogymnoascus sp. VKM F-4517 (FW-2822)]
MAHQESNSEVTVTVPPAQNESTEKPPVVTPWHPSQYPDGGFKAWLVTAGAFFCVFCSFGWINCEHTLERGLISDCKNANEETQALAFSKTTTSSIN